MTWTARLAHQYEILCALVSMQLKIRYRRSVLGYLWSVAHPLATACVFYLLLQVLAPGARANTGAFLLAGLFPWQWIGNSVNGGTKVFLANRVLIKKIALPRYLLCIAQVLQDGWHFMVSVPILLGLLAINGFLPSWETMVGIACLGVLQAVLLTGVSLLLGSLNMVLRDMEHLVHVLLLSIFYCTPVIYETSQVPERFRWLMHINPLAPLIEGWRQVLLQGVLPWSSFTLTAAYAALFLAGGLAVYHRLNGRFASVG